MPAPRKDKKLHPPELKEELQEVAAYYRNAFGVEALRTLRAIINGKLGKRAITKEQQEKMQAARKKTAAN